MAGMESSPMKTSLPGPLSDTSYADRISEYVIPPATKTITRCFTPPSLTDPLALVPRFDAADPRSLSTDAEEVFFSAQVARVDLSDPGAPVVDAENEELVEVDDANRARTEGTLVTGGASRT